MIKSNFFSKILFFVIIAEIWSAGTIVVRNTTEINHTLNSSGLTIFAGVVAFLMVTRFSLSLKRWDDGRILLGKSINDISSLAEILYPRIGAELMKKNIIPTLYNYSIALNHDLRKIDTAPCNPRHITAELNNIIHQLGLEMILDNAEERTCLMITCGLNEVTGGCQRIQNSKMPTSIVCMIRVIVATFIAVLSLFLDGPTALILTPIISFTLIGLEIAAEAMEDPFGTDATFDHDLDHIVKKSKLPSRKLLYKLKSALETSTSNTLLFYLTLTAWTKFMRCPSG